MRATIVWTWALSAFPLPDTADLTSEGVWTAIGRPARPTHVIAAPITCMVVVTDCRLSWANTRSIATTSGRYCSMTVSIASAMVRRRKCVARSLSVRATPT